MITSHIPPPSSERIFEFKKALADLQDEFQKKVTLHDDFVTLHKKSLENLADAARSTMELYNRQLALLESCRVEAASQLDILQDNFRTLQIAHQIEDAKWAARLAAAEQQLSMAWEALGTLRLRLWVRIGAFLRFIPKW